MEKNTSKRSAIVHKIAAGAAFAIAAVFLCYAPAEAPVEAPAEAPAEAPEEAPAEGTEAPKA